MEIIQDENLLLEFSCISLSVLPRPRGLAPFTELFQVCTLTSSVESMNYLLLPSLKDFFIFLFFAYFHVVPEVATVYFSVVLSNTTGWNLGITFHRSKGFINVILIRQCLRQGVLL